MQTDEATEPEQRKESEGQGGQPAGLSVKAARRKKMKAKKKRAKKKMAKKRDKDRREQEEAEKRAEIVAAEEEARKRRRGQVVVVTNTSWSRLNAEKEAPETFSFLGPGVKLPDVAVPKEEAQTREQEQNDDGIGEKAPKKKKVVATEGGSLFESLERAKSDDSAAKTFHREDPSNVMSSGWRHTRAALVKDFRNKKKAVAKHAKEIKKLGREKI